MKNVKIGIIGAMDVEIASLLESITDKEVTSAAGMEFQEGKMGDVPVVVVKSGVGKVNAAICTQILIDRFGVTHIINTGIAGSLDSRVDIGDVVISVDAIYHDVDVTVFGYSRGEVPGMDTIAFPSDPEFRELIKNAVVHAADDIRVFSGRVVSGDCFVSSRSVKEFIKKTTDGLCVEMEGAAVAQTAYVNRVPFVIVRFISDNAADNADKSYEEFEAEAAHHSAEILKNAILLISRAD